MGETRESRRRFVRATAFAVLCAVLIAAAAAIPSASATKVKPIGKAKGHTPKPLCPQKPPESQNPPSVKRPCFVTGSVTGFQLKANGEHHITKATQSGKIVSW